MNMKCCLYSHDASLPETIIIMSRTENSILLSEEAMGATVVSTGLLAPKGMDAERKYARLAKLRHSHRCKSAAIAVSHDGLLIFTTSLRKESQGDATPLVCATWSDSRLQEVQVRVKKCIIGSKPTLILQFKACWFSLIFGGTLELHVRTSQAEQFQTAIQQQIDHHKNDKAVPPTEEDGLRGFTAFNAESIMGDFPPADPRGDVNMYL